MFAKLLKYLKLLTSPTTWPTLWAGVVPAIEHKPALKLLSPKTIIDVGANKGQFAVVCRQLFQKATIMVFEPLEPERLKIQRVVASPLIVERSALGEFQGVKTFYMTSRRDSSSLFQPTNLQRTAFGVTLSDTVEVPIDRLAEIANKHPLEQPILLKIDVQGAELNVLKGACELLRQIDAIYCELSYQELYENQPLASEVIGYLNSQGFSIRGVFNQVSGRAKQPLQADFLFIKNRKN